MSLSPLGIALTQAQAQPAPSHPGQIGPTDVLGAYSLSTNAANQQYLAKLQQQNALWGGLAGLGSAGVLAAPRLYQSGMLKGLFGPTTDPAAAGNVFSTGADAIPYTQGADLFGAPGATGGASVADATAGALGGDAALTGGGTAALDAGAGSVAGDLAGTAGLGTVAGDLAGTAAAGVGADAAGASLADLLPFLFLA